MPYNPIKRYTEDERLDALARYDILDTPPERELDDVVRIAAKICDVPIAMISLVDDKRQWFKATIGLEASETPRKIALCALAIDQTDTLTIEDASRDDRFIDNPLISGELNLRFYAGAQLITPDGLAIGTLCVVDRKPRRLSDDQKELLEALARQVMTHFELRRLLTQKLTDEKGLRDSETRGRLALDAAELGAWEAVPGTSQLYGDARARKILGHEHAAEMSFDTFLAHIHSEDSPRFAAAVVAALAGSNEGRLDIEYRVHPKGNEGPRWLRSRAQVIKAPGERHRLVGTVRDISAEKAAEEHRKLLNNELQHRVKNTLGVVQGIVSQSLRTVATPSEASAAITSRLVTLAHAHDMLTQTSWVAAPIAAIVDGAVLAHLADRSRVEVTGPPIQLRARSALALSMALHELFTNAVKYGSLSNDTGCVTIGWAISDSGEGGPNVELTWREQGGPPVSAPTRKGFGTRLTGDSLAGDLGGKGITKYAPDGVSWSLFTKLQAISESPISFGL